MPLKTKNSQRPPMNKITSWLSVRNAAPASSEPAEMMIYGQIGKSYYSDEKGVEAGAFQTALKGIDANTPVNLHIHSPGGNVWEAFAIHGMIKNRGNVTTICDGIAASSASVIFQAGAKRIMPKLSMQMAHNPQGYCDGDADEMRAVADKLDAHANVLAEMYASATGQTVKKCREIMDSETWMGGQECLDNGFCDELTDDEPVENKIDLTGFRNVPKALQNQTQAPKSALATTPTQKNIMNRDEMIAALRARGIEVANDATDAWLKDQVSNLLKKPEPAAATLAAPANKAADAAVVVDFKALQNKIDALEAQRNAERTTRITNEVDACVRDDRVPAAQRDNWIKRAVADEAVLNDLRNLPAKPPGVSPVSLIDITKDGEEDIIKNVYQLRAPTNAMLSGRLAVMDKEFRSDVATASGRTSVMVRNHIERITANVHWKDEVKRREVIGNWLDQIDRAERQMSVRNDTAQTYTGVSVSSDLQRQVIFSESMRAFERRMVPLTPFAHTWNNVPLQGKDEIDVPYYPLFTTGSQRYTASQGYKFATGDQVLRKQITVGGSGPDNKVAGVDRAYQAMTWSAYLLRRQPWADVVKMATMRAEQLALDVVNDIITAWVLKANFGSAIWAGVPAAFDDTVVAQLAGACRKSDWPEGQANLIIGTDYWVNLVSSPYVKSYLNIGDTGAIRNGRIGGLYGFDDTIENPRLPQTSDGNLVGWVCYPSALGVATSPIMPAPGELKMMVNYDLVTSASGMTFEYKYWGEPWNSADREIIESNYGSGLLELAALKRIVSNGN